MKTLIFSLVFVVSIFAQNWLQQVKSQLEQCQNLKQVDSLVTIFEQQHQQTPKKLLHFYNSALRSIYLVREREIRSIPQKDQQTQIKKIKTIHQQYENLVNHIYTKAADLCQTLPPDSLNDELQAYCKTFKIVAANLRFEKELRSKPRPDFVFTDLNGKQHHLYDFKGHYVLLHFWNMHSQPCVAELPYLRQVWEKYAPKGLVIINFHLTVGHPDAQWEAEALTNFIKESEMPGLQVAGEQAAKIKEQYFIRNYPTLFLLNPESIVIKPEKRRMGLSDDLRGKKLLQTLKEVFGE